MRWEMVIWASLAVLLIAAESIVPGAFLLWLGLAAAGVFLLVSLVPGLGVLAQVIAFVLLSFLSIAAYRRWFARRAPRSDNPTLNRRADQLVGRETVLLRGTEHGNGQVRLDDAYWMVSGVPLAEGTRVRITGVDGMVLRIDRVDDGQ